MRIGYHSTRVDPISCNFTLRHRSLDDRGSLKRSWPWVRHSDPPRGAPRDDQTTQTTVVSLRRVQSAQARYSLVGIYGFANAQLSSNHQMDQLSSEGRVSLHELLWKSDLWSHTRKNERSPRCGVALGGVVASVQTDTGMISIYIYIHMRICNCNICPNVIYRNPGDLLRDARKCMAN